MTRAIRYLHAMGPVSEKQFSATVVQGAADCNDEAEQGSGVDRDLPLRAG
jgi:hypothetical protein